MYKNQLQELAQRSCFNLPSYACVREGPDHAPRFKASVNFNGEIFESPSYCPTLRQAEHAAAEVALNILSTRGPSRSLTARVLDKTGIYKNLLQETAHRAGLNLPVYTTVRSGPGHVPIFTSTVELAGLSFTGEPAKTKKQAEKNAAIAAWSALKRMPNLDSWTNKEADNREEQDQAVVAKVLSSFKPKDESKQLRKRDFNQTRRRVIRGQKDIGMPSSSTSTNSLLHQQWRFMDLLMDSVLDGSTQKQNSFVSLLPPPPPRTASKILPPTSPTVQNPSNFSSNNTIPIRIRGKSQVKLPEIPTPPVEEQLENVEGLIGAKPDFNTKNNKPIEKECPNSRNSLVYGASSSIYRPISLSSILKSESSQINSNIFGSPSPSAAPYIGRTMYTGGFRPQKIAPAVQIRSVIPVCAAPPPSMRPQQTEPSSSVKEASAASLTAASPSPPPPLSKQTGVVAEVSQVHPVQLSSELMKLQL